MIYIPCSSCTRELVVDIMKIQQHPQREDYRLCFYTEGCPECRAFEAIYWQGGEWRGFLPRFRGEFNVYDAWQSNMRHRVENYLDCFTWSDPDMIRDALVSAGVPGIAFVPVYQPNEEVSHAEA